jgi:hypothetical protein
MVPHWRHLAIAGSLMTASVVSGQRAPAPLAVDHLWIVVSPGAPERAALERAGFLIAPGPRISVRACR